jgi:hypothetical protein
MAPPETAQSTTYTPIFRVQVSFCAFREGIEKINSIFAVCRVNWADW